MARKKNWFELLKRFFRSETKSKQEKKEKRKIWLSGRLKSQRSKSLEEAEKEQSKHAVAVAVATAAAAEAAVAAAQIAAQVVRLTATPSSRTRAQLEVAAIKIQSAFRGLLARRALQALKGLVKLQALIRGQAVRRKTTSTLRGLQSIMKIQSQARAIRVRMAEDHWADGGKDIVYPKAKGSTLPQSIGRRWDGSILSKQEIIAILNNWREAAIKRERATEYALSHRERRRPTTPVSKEFEPNAGYWRWSWLDQWVDSQPLGTDIPESFSTPSRDRTTREEVEEIQFRHLARRSFNQSRTTSLRDDDDDSFSSSPFYPSYMAPTASAKARFRSLSTPKQRLRTIDSYSEYCAPCTDGVHSPFPSNASDAGLIRKTCKRLKSPQVPLKSDRSFKYLSFDSECSLLNWDQHNALS